MQKIEKQLIDLEYILVMDDHANQSEHMLFLHDLFIRLWEFLAGEKRPKQPNKSKFKMQKNLYRTKMPKICKGLPIRLGKWNTLERDTISTFKVSVIHESFSLADKSNTPFVFILQ